MAKDSHEVLLEAPGWRSRKRIRLHNTAADFRSFAEFLRSLGLPVRIGFEPTGNYHRALAYFLHAQGFELRLISSLALARTREAMHNSWDKNDPKDAQVILHLLKSGLTQHYHDPIVHHLNDLQELSKTHHELHAFPSAVMLDSVLSSGWRPASPSACGKTVSAPSSNATCEPTRTARIGNGRHMSLLPPRSRVSLTHWFAPAPISAASLK